MARPGIVPLQTATWFFWLTPAIAIGLRMWACLLHVDYGAAFPQADRLDSLGMLVFNLYLLVLLVLVGMGIAGKRLPLFSFALALLHGVLLWAILLVMMYPFVFFAFIHAGGEFMGATRASGWPVELGYYLVSFATWYGLSGRFLRRMVARALELEVMAA
jgi:hypothetical protein